MSNKHNHKNRVDNEPKAVDNDDIEINDVADEESADVEAAKEMAQEELDEVEKLRKELDDTKAQLEKEKKEYLFLMAEFDNFRKRTLKEKSELIKNGGESAMKGLLPIIDDFERSIQAINESSDASFHQGRGRAYLQQVYKISGTERCHSNSYRKRHGFRHRASRSGDIVPRRR